MNQENEQLSPEQQKIAGKCIELAEFLIAKNRKYGNSALKPIRVFSKANMLEQIKVRMDDKINRIRNEQSDEDEDVYKDLAGYLVLYMVARDEIRGEQKMTKEELTEDQLYKILKQTYELSMHGDLYKLAGYNEKVVQLISISEAADLRVSCAELLEEIKSSDMPVEFFQLTKFASIE